MGCDIHLFVEERKNGVWQSADVWTIEDGRQRVHYDSHIYTDRNYRLFALLAGVRNDGNYTPIAPPRGLPDDVCFQVKAEREAWGCDGHSDTWYTVRELLDHDWNTKVEVSGLVTADGYREWKNCGAPDSWCQAAFGGKTRHVTVAEMEAICADPIKSDRCYVQVLWTKYHHQILGSLANAMVRALHRARPEDVRFVMWFDN